MEAPVVFVDVDGGCAVNRARSLAPSVPFLSGL